MLKKVLFASSALLLIACASGPSSGAPSRNRNLITAEEIEGLPVTTARDLVERLRPTWLRPRGPASMGSSRPEFPVVYIDQVHSGGLEALDRVSSLVIEEVRFISARDATTRFGMNHGGGAILVKVRRRDLAPPKASPTAPSNPRFKPR